MKVLFAVSSESISEAIIKRYQKEYKEILSYKNVYYFNAILKEIQKDKTYDRIVISEDLEPFSNNNYEAIDKFIFEKLDNISDEAQDIDGNETSIVLICTDRHAKGNSFLVKIFGIGIYNALLGSDRSMEQVCRLINKPRVKKEAKAYYGIDAEDVSYNKESDKEVSELEIQNILTHFKKISKNQDKFADSFNNIAAQYTDDQLKIIVNCLPINVKAVLEEDSPKYQELMRADGIGRVNRERLQTKADENKTGIKIDIIENVNKQPMSGPIVIPSSVRNTKNTKSPQAVRPQGNKIEINIEDKAKTNKKVKVISKNKPTEEAVEEAIVEETPVTETKAEMTAEEKERRRKLLIAKKKKELLKKKALLEKKKALIAKKKELIAKKKAEAEAAAKETEKEEVEEDSTKANAEAPRKKLDIQKTGVPPVLGNKQPDIADDLDIPENDFEDELPGLEAFDETDDTFDELPGIEEDTVEENTEDLPGLDDLNDELPGIEETPDFEETDDTIETTELDDDLPGMDDVEEEALPGLDSVEEDLPGLDDFNDELPTMDDVEEELPGTEDLEDELPGAEDLEEDILPGMDDFDEEDSLPAFEDDFEEDSIPTAKDNSNETIDSLDEDSDLTEEVDLPELDELDDMFGDDLDEGDDLLPDLDDTSDSMDLGLDDDNTDSIDSEVETTTEIESIKPTVDYSMSNLNSLLTKEKKIVTFIGTSKNGTSFLVNNLAALFSSCGINTAILDMTRNKNSYYIYTNNEEELRKTAFNSISKLQKGFAEGIKVNKNLSVYTALPNDGKDYSDAEPILSTLVQNHSLVLIDCDFETDASYFASCQEIYLVQSMDVLTIQPLTGFLRDLKAKGVLESEKVRVVINKELKVKSLNVKAIIGGMSFYNDPQMSFMTELFNKDMVKACSIPFDENAYARYLDSMANCNISINQYSKQFINRLKILGDMVYTLISKSTYNKPVQQTNYGKNNFSNNMTNTLNQMKKKI